MMFIRGRYGHGGRPGYDKEWRAEPERSGGGELIDQVEAALGAVRHGHGYGAVQRNNRRRLCALKQIIEADDLRPICLIGPCCLTMDGGNCRLQRKWASSTAKSLGDQRQSLGNLTVIPTAPVLLFENNEYFKTVTLDYSGGAKYPHLERVSGQPDVLADILRPRLGK